MKQTKINKTMALMLALVMITSVFVGNTLSRYVTSVNSTDSARVAIWGINGAETTMNLFNNQYDADGKAIVKSNDGDKVIAPGTSGSSPFSIVNIDNTIAPEVAYKISIELDDSQIADTIKNNTSIQWKLDDGSWGTLDALKTSILSLSGSPTGSYTYGPGEFATAFKGTQTHTIAWQWLMDNSNNINDTAMGNAALTSDINAQITVKVKAEQIDDLITNEYILNGANQTVNVNNVQPLTVRSSSPYDTFTNVKVNGEILDPSNYETSEGSTIVTLKESYLSTLPTGRYTLEIVAQDVAKTVFEIVDELYVSETLSENSWETIQTVAKSGQAANYWSVGDKTTVDVNGTDYKVAIADFNYDGENTITFVFTEKVGEAEMNLADEQWEYGYNVGGWKESEMRNYTLPTIYDQMENKDYIKEVEKETPVGYGSNPEAPNTLETTTDKLFLLSHSEAFGGYEYFKTDENRIIKDETNNEIWWWLRDPMSGDNIRFYTVADMGEWLDNYACDNYGIVPAFVIG